MRVIFLWHIQTSKMRIIGLAKSGLSLAAGLLVCAKLDVRICSVSMSDYDTLGLSLLDRLHARSLHTKYIWIVRNPATMICKYILDMDISPEKAAKLWFDVNTIIWHFIKRLDHITVKFEDLLLEEQSARKLFEFANLQYNSNYLRYGDFDQPSCLYGKSFDKGIIDIEEVNNYDKQQVDWRNIRSYNSHPILHKLGYKIQEQN